MTESWSRAHVTTIIETVTYTSTIEYGVPDPSPNSTYSVLCDGLPRFDSDGEADNATVLLPTPITTISSSLTGHYIWPTRENFPPAPSCSIRNDGECSVAWSLFGSSLSSSQEAWSTNNILTVSLGSPLTSVVVNSRQTLLTAHPGSYPTLTLHGEEYGANQGTYTISGATNLYGEVTLTPGGRQVLTWDMDQVLRPFGPSVGNCTQPSGKIIQHQCATAQCTVKANSVELLYFPPPSTSRDLCANTSPGFNSYSVSIYSHPHASTIINSTTYWSDKAYVRYDEVWAYKWCSLDNDLAATLVPVGGTYTSHLVEVSSSDVSSICGYMFNPTRPYGLLIAATAKPFNFQDLLGDIPASAFQCLPRCGRGGFCDEIISSWYYPGLAVPPQVRARDPEWASCVPQFDGVPDPPIALGSVPNFLTTSTRSETLATQPPSPGHLISTGASATAIPITEPPINTRFTSAITLPSSRPAPNDPDVSVDPIPNDSRPIRSRPNNPPSNKPGSNNSPPFDSDPAASTPPQSPQDTSMKLHPGTNPSTGPTTIGNIGNSIVETDPSHPGTITISNPNMPGGARTLTAGSDPVVISGTTISVNPTGGAVAVSGASTLQPVGIVNGKLIFTDPNQPGIIIVGDPELDQPTQTLSVSGPSVVIDGETLILSPTASVQASTTFAGISIVVFSDSTVLVDNAHTIRPGDREIFVNGHKVAVDSKGVIWVDDQRVETVPVSGDQSDGMTTPSSTRTILETPDPSGSVTKEDTSPTGPQAPQFSSEASEALMVLRRWDLVYLVILMIAVAAV